ncbi:hypothetical protein QFZ63_003129 [Streptomyces sp. B3I7]|uniref:hypothetical protein n=1 Tax=Streptomyces sp. B3I7 TaxID=3042269 RepID=UPI002784D219|nr:hypothetical protein [Streptomyces sp. B3I7]MDQ0811415.1 hypothetical protein [Streptomyces sp. B3I7]
MSDIGRAVGNPGPDPAVSAAMRRVLDSDPAVRAAPAKFTRPNPAVLQVLRHADTNVLSSGTRKAMEAAAESQQRVPPAAPHAGGTGSGQDDSGPEADETG